MDRPLFSSNIEQLEQLFSQSTNKAQLQKLAEELAHRTTPRAKKLFIEVDTALKSKPAIPFKTGEQISIPLPPIGKITNNNPEIITQVDLQPSPTKIFCKPDNAPSQQPYPFITNAPYNVLSAWTALEALSPQSFNRPEDLAGGDRTRVINFNESMLPWERGLKSRPNYRLYYQIVLGEVALEPAFNCLIEHYGDPRPEKPNIRGRAALAIVVVNQKGILVDSPAIGVSSFAWGVMQALKNSLPELSQWPAIEKQLVAKMETILLGGAINSGDQEKARERPISRKSLIDAYQMLVTILGLPAQWVTNSGFAIKSYVYIKDSNSPEPLLLNSFFLDDLALAQQTFSMPQAKSLQQYLGMIRPKQHYNLLQDKEALNNAVSPQLTPLARWPSYGNHPLVLLQQAAVNLSFQETKEGGILGINGPPGTGKTTLLRDLVAGVITQRAEAMAQYDNPSEAFKHSGQKIKVGNGWLHLYQLDEALRGFELLVASSNNKAVENVSAELPALKAIADDAIDLRYFTSLSDNLHKTQTWGAVAAVLGNTKNRGQFKQDFWWDEDYGINSYLQAASGSPPQIEVQNPETGEITYRLPYIVEKESPPKTLEDALARWKKARNKFLKALDTSRKMQYALEHIRQESQQLYSSRQKVDVLLRNYEQLGVEVSKCENDLAILAKQDKDAKLQYQDALDALPLHQQSKPSFLASLFRTKTAKNWSEQYSLLQSQSIEIAKNLQETNQKLKNQEQKLKKLTIDKNDAANTWQAAAKKCQETERNIIDAQKNQGIIFTDSDFFELASQDYQQLTPWFTSSAQKLRDDVFVAAMQLHRAFIDAAAKPLRHNLGVLMNIFTSQTLPDQHKQALLPHLWSSLFIVIPLVSTTFASVNRMLGKLPLNSLGWLLVDEAGQALPQAIIGALLRTQRAVVVGDPIQIEPVVILPATLTTAICRRFGVDPDLYAAPTASVQTLADAASEYVTEIESKHGSRNVGVPLLVHRRCSEPMFSISNAVAYSNLMIYAKSARPSPIRDVLGASRWIHIEGGDAEDKWSEAEGNAVIDVLLKLAQAQVKPDIYIVTPFVIVADHLRKKIRQNKLLENWIAKDLWLWTTEHIGTVHTVQGREAEAVIFVLGAPQPSQTGARAWAGSRPNLLNVAATRAKEALYVIGNRKLWKDAGLFRELSNRLSD